MAAFCDTLLKNNPETVDNKIMTTTFSDDWDTEEPTQQETQPLRVGFEARMEWRDERRYHNPTNDQALTVEIPAFNG